MSLTEDRLAFAALSIDFEVIIKVLMLIRIICLDKLYQNKQRSNIDRYNVEIIAATTACYTD